MQLPVKLQTSKGACWLDFSGVKSTFFAVYWRHFSFFEFEDDCVNIAHVQTDAFWPKLGPGE